MHAEGYPEQRPTAADPLLRALQEGLRNFVPYHGGSVNSVFDYHAESSDLDSVGVVVGFAQTGLEEKALKLFVKIVKKGIEVDQNMVSPLFWGFGSDTTLALGKQIHSLLSSNPFVSNGLINMYSKCGGLGESIKVFNRMPMRNSVSWNSMIVAFARHGNGSRALQLYKEMRLEGVRANRCHIYITASCL
ncbi:hypothetical protein HHK36_022783 [Tetracentron sinense]|uniref:Pentatricopeptide repeat-containing protein n=1 Tax=Tetracentron sinense TaxID=13715 RepID=A0A834YSJ7_TETSI|nr:hypothetical protein HHK36_022783 [Tetracentron sinense]